MTAKFEMSVKDYNLSAEIKLGVRDEYQFPNHSDIREAINRMMHALANWDYVDITIKTVPQEGEE